MAEVKVERGFEFINDEPSWRLASMVQECLGLFEDENEENAICAPCRDRIILLVNRGEFRLAEEALREVEQVKEI